MATLFTKIINKEIPAHIVAEDSNNIAFLDINPLAEGHVLVVPKKEVDYYFDLEDQDYNRLNLFAKKVAKAIEASVSCQRVGVAVVGLEIPHTHIHLVPLNTMNDINFNKQKLALSEDKMKAIADRIRENY
jgi:histidine triad (HIT) family protein